jgi:hypothetical protein
MVARKVKSYFDSLHLQFQSRVFVYHNHRMRMELQTRKCPHMIDTSLDALLQCHCLMSTSDDNHNFSCFKHSLDAHRQGHLWDLLQVIIEESRVRKDSVIGQRLHSGPARQAGARLVECDVSIWSNSSKEKIDAANSLDFGLILHALRFKVRRIPIEDVDIGRVDIDVAEEMLIHERVVRLRVFAGNTDVLVLSWPSALSCTRLFLHPRHADEDHRTRRLNRNLKQSCLHTILNVTTCSKDTCPALYAATRSL